MPPYFFFVLVVLFASVLGSSDDELVNRRVIGGYRARKGEFPYQAILRERNNGKQYCGGTIISDKWILTAGHCVVDENNIPDLLYSPEEIEVVVGSNCVKSVKMVYKVEKLIPYKGFRKQNKTVINDIALIKVNGSLIRRGYTNKALLPSRNQSFVGRKGTASGFGFTRPKDDFSQSPILRAVNLNIMPPEDCVKDHGNKFIPSSMLCVGDKRGGKDTCEGDSGGPLVVSTSAGPVLAGIVSWGDIWCGRPDKPGVFTNVAAFVDFIRGTISRN